MGQRLTINVKGSDDRDFRFTTYFHNGAYTRSAILLTLDFLKLWEGKYRRMKGLCQNDRLLLCATEAWPGSGLVENDANEIALVDAGFRKFAMTNCGIPKGTDGSKGLIAVSESEAEVLVAREDGRVDIHVSKGGAASVWFDVWRLIDVDEDGALDDPDEYERAKDSLKVSGDAKFGKAMRELYCGNDVKADGLRIVYDAVDKAIREGHYDILLQDEGILLEVFA